MQDKEKSDNEKEKKEGYEDVLGNLDSLLEKMPDILNSINDINEDQKMEGTDKNQDNPEKETSSSINPTEINSNSVLKKDEEIEIKLNLDVDENSGAAENQGLGLNNTSEPNHEDISSDEKKFNITTENNTANTIPVVEDRKNDFPINSFSDELNALISKDPPPNVDGERIKNVGFIYSSDDDKIFTECLKGVDDITQSCQEKPMFIKRAFVMRYDDSFSKEAMLLNADSEKVIAVVLVGEMPVELKYDIENALTQNGIYFTEFNKNNITKSRLIDFIIDLIVR
ncbi:MAG: hypothetical protein KA059_01590 [Elusimicrobiales bacterium]|nr:hypothetical protein [Elusimicrobiales bacterium]